MIVRRVFNRGRVVVVVVARIACGEINDYALATGATSGAGEAGVRSQ